MTAEFIVATHALAYLNHKRAWLSSEEIAENVCTNPARVRKVLLKLKAAGLVTARAGAEGGYAFAGDPATVTLLDIFCAVESAVIRLKWRSGDPEMDCTVASGMGAIMDGVFARMDESCKRELNRLTLADIDSRLFATSAPPAP